MVLLRGAKPTSPERIAAATPFVPKRRRLDLPLQFICIPKGPLSFWGNDAFGDCVTAEEAAEARGPVTVAGASRAAAHR